MSRASLEALRAAAESAEAAYAADPGSHTLPPYVAAWDQVLTALTTDVDLAVQASAAHHGAVAHLQVFRHYGDDDHAQVAVTLLTRLRADAPSDQLRFAAAADLATLAFDRYLVNGGRSLFEPLSTRRRRRCAGAQRASPTGRPVSAFATAAGNLAGHTLLRRHDRGGRRRDLDAAIDAWTHAVDLAPPEAALRPSYLASLANGLRERAARRGADAATADLVESVTLLREAVAALTGFRELAGQLANLGLSLHGLAVRTEDVAGDREACATFAAAVESGLQVAPGEALRAGLAWQAMAVDTVADWPQAAAAGDGVLRALWALLVGQLLRPGKETWLRTASGVAAVTALAHVRDDPAAAASALENGRALMLSEVLPPIESLRATRPDLARRYTAAATALAAGVRAADRRGLTMAGTPIATRAGR